MVPYAAGNPCGHLFMSLLLYFQLNSEIMVCEGKPRMAQVVEAQPPMWETGKKLWLLEFYCLSPDHCSLLRSEAAVERHLSSSVSPLSSFNFEINKSQKEERFTKLIIKK